jgi:YbbR domain-containing protein
MGGTPRVSVGWTEADLMHKPLRFNRALFDNMVWFAGSMVLAFFIWVIATIQSDPIQQGRFAGRVDVQMSPDTGLLITNPPPTNRTASVVVRAPRSTFDLLSNDEINVWADLAGLGPGEHLVELQASLARPQATVIDISPSVIRVTLEESAQRQIPLRAVVTREPPAGYAREEPVFDVTLNQVLVSGPASKVEEVVAAQVSLDLSPQRNPYDSDARLTAVDSDGDTVDEVTIDPQVVHVTVPIRRRDDVSEIEVRPQLIGSLPDGYILNGISSEPSTILVSGSPDQLQELPDRLSTQSIDLSNRTSSFELSVPVLLPNNDLLVLSVPNITVSIEITPLMTSRQFDNIPVEVLGVTDGYTANLIPDSITVVVTGPQPQLDPLREADIRITLDLNGLLDGDYSLTPVVTIGQGEFSSAGVSILPPTVDVVITMAVSETAEP